MWLKANGGTSLMNRILILLAGLGAAACASFGDSRAPIATELLPAPQPSALRTLVIVLPGRNDGGRGANERAMARAIHEAWPGADVLLASATYVYYRDGKVVERLREDVVEPALRAGYRRIWLAGASMGGMGAMLYERAYSGQLAGVVLFAPFLGDKPLLEEIRNAGGVRQWDPGPLPAEVNARNYQRQVWKHIRERSAHSSVWLACGSEDYLLNGARLLATTLPEGRFIEMPGSHDWRTWSRIGKTVFSQIRTQEPDTL
jgi:pimeloyl-ACP methyl ester carboxylesterase